MSDMMKPEEYRNQLLFGDKECVMKSIDEFRNRLIQGNCLDVLRSMPDCCVTACVTDSPYGLSNCEPTDVMECLKAWTEGKKYNHNKSGFMGKSWDGWVAGPEVWKEVMRVLKPGGHILSFYGTRTYDLGVLAMRIAGCEIRDKIDYYCEQTSSLAWVYGQGFPKSLDIQKAMEKQGLPKEVSDKWTGMGSALKPAHEPIAVFTKGEGKFGDPDVPFFYEGKCPTKERDYGCRNMFWKTVNEITQRIPKDEYLALQKENEDNKGKEGYVPHVVSHGNIWPTVKPVDLMRYLVKLVKMPEDNLILEPFMGSGSTIIGCILEGCDYIGIDMDPVAFEISTARAHYFRCLGKKGLK